MTRDPLKLLLRLRHRAMEHARLAVVDAVHRQAEAETALQQMDHRAERDRQAAMAMTETDPYLGHIVERGRERLRTERAAAERHLNDATALTAARRRSLTEARSQSETVEQLVANRKAAAADLVERRTAHELGDIFRTQMLRRQRAERS